MLLWPNLLTKCPYYIQLFNCEVINPINAELNTICHLLALLGTHQILHVSGIRVKLLEEDIKKFCIFLLIPSFYRG